MGWAVTLRGLIGFAHRKRDCARRWAPRASNGQLSGLANEKIGLSSIERESIGMGQADAVPSLLAADKIPIASISRDDLI
jgi:hypothetical protein